MVETIGDFSFAEGGDKGWPPTYRGHLQKKSPSWGIFQRRYVVLHQGVLYWSGNESRFNGQELQNQLGSLNFGLNPCEVAVSGKDQFRIRPMGDGWKDGQFTGVDRSREFLFDCSSNSAYNLDEWVQGFSSHIKMSQWAPLKKETSSQEPEEDRDKKRCHLRIIQITDVYTLENFPSLATLIQEKHEEIVDKGGQTVSMLTGDFLAPYLLSSVDAGVGMMDMCNHTPIDILTWGNHENDVPHEDVMRREKEYTGKWINTNMQSHESFENSLCQVDALILELISQDGSNTRKVGFIGVLSADPTLYRPGAFGGATIDDPWETMATYKEKLEKEQGCDLVVPLCHLYENQDERTCREFNFPLILSGHDHHLVDRVIDGTRLLKPGSDAHYACMIDLIWDTADSGNIPRIEADTLRVADWPPHMGLQERVEQAYAILEPLRRTQLAKIPSSFRPCSSKGARNRRVSMGTFLLSQMRDALNAKEANTTPCDCCIIKGGNVRGGRDYSDNDQLTLEALKSELEERQEVQVCYLPGSIIRIGLQETWEMPNPGWMQYCDAVEVDDDGFVNTIRKQPLDTEKLYAVATFGDFFRKRDAPSIGAYFEEHPEHLPEKDAGIPCHALLFSFFAEDIWSQVWDALEPSSTDDDSKMEVLGLDLEGRDHLSRDELIYAITRIVGLECYDGSSPLADTLLQKYGSDEDRNTVYCKRKELRHKLQAPEVQAVVNRATQAAIARRSQIRATARTTRSAAPVRASNRTSIVRLERNMSLLKSGDEA